MSLPIHPRARIVLPLSLAVAALVLLPGCTPPAETAAEAAPATLESDEQKTLYAVGMAVADQLAAFDLSEEDLAIVSMGIEDGVLDRDEQVPLQEWGPKIGELAQTRQASRAEREKERGRAYVEAESARPGAELRDSGMVYLEVQPGNGDKPTPGDTVRIEYEGRLVDGEVFDSSERAGEPAEFRVDAVVPCFSEGLQQMMKGGKAKLICPPDLAYGDSGFGGRIPPGATIEFDIELLAINPPPAG